MAPTIDCSTLTGSAPTSTVTRPGGAGSLEPKRAYELFSTSTPTTTTPAKTGFYVGGSIYADWAAVPDRYKDMGSADRPDPRRSTASLFKFTW
jgi:hypothetical protein